MFCTATGDKSIALASLHKRLLKSTVQRMTSWAFCAHELAGWGGAAKKSGGGFRPTTALALLTARPVLAKCLASIKTASSLMQVQHTGKMKKGMPPEGAHSLYDDECSPHTPATKPVID